MRKRLATAEELKKIEEEGISCPVSGVELYFGMFVYVCNSCDTMMHIQGLEDSNGTCPSCNSSDFDEVYLGYEMPKRFAGSTDNISTEKPYWEYLSDNIETVETVSVAQPKSYVGYAWLTFFLYFIGFWLVGFLTNIAWFNAAKNTRREIGTDPPGIGCLGFLLWFGVIMLIGIIIFAIFMISNL